MEKKAELSVDERFKSKFEVIKTYFESNMTKILLNQGNGIEKTVELGREICSLKLVIGKLEAKLLSSQHEREALEVNLKYYKEQVALSGSKQREL